MLAQFEDEIDIPENIVEEIFELLLEEYPEPEIEEEGNESEADEEEEENNEL